MARVARVVPALALAGIVVFAQTVGAETSGLSGAASAAGPSSDSGPESLASLLSSGDRERYRRIFALQAEGRFESADKLISALDDPLLLGHVQAQRYLHPTAYRSSFRELADWLSRYADHPDARRIHELALGRMPEGAAAPQQPAASPASLTAPPRGAGRSYRSPQERSEAEWEAVKALKGKLREAVSDDKLAEAKALLEAKATRKLLDPVEIDQGYAKIAAARFYGGSDKAALALASKVAARSGKDVPIAHWIAGLAAWRLGDYAQAAEQFRGFAQSERASRWSAAAGAFWAARARERLGESFNQQFWLLRAALQSNTFYGLLARRTLTAELSFDFRPQRLSPESAALLAESGEGRRALALLQAGQGERAMDELLRVGGWAEPEVARALVAAANAVGEPAQAYRLGARLDRFQQTFETAGLDAALYPIPPWEPRQGFEVDRALIYAMIRKESRFDPKAVSPFGAAGLMQVMPATASYIDGEDYSGDRAKALLDPSLNLELGQRYIGKLLESKAIGGDLFHLAAAYNGGPGLLGRWKKALAEVEDPLLFIEILPALETRVFIEHVLTNLWIYRTRLGQPTPSLDALAQGDWPRYESLDPQTIRVARRGAN